MSCLLVCGCSSVVLLLMFSIMFVCLWVWMWMWLIRVNLVSDMGLIFVFDFVLFNGGVVEYVIDVGVVVFGVELFG